MSQEGESQEAARQNELSREDTEPERSDVERVEEAVQAIVRAIETGSDRFWEAQVEATRPKNRLVGSMMFVASTWVVFFAIFSMVTLLIGWKAYGVSPLHSLERIAHQQKQQVREETQAKKKRHLGAYFVDLGERLLLVGEPEAARAEFETALELDPLNPEANRRLLECELFESIDVRSKDYDPTVIEPKLDKLVEERPKDTYVYAFRGILRSNQVNYEAALSDLNKAVSLNDSNAYAYSGIATVYYEKGKFDKAVEISKKALERAPGNPYYKGNYAGALYAAEQYKDAIRVYEGVTFLDSEYVIPFHDLAQLYRLRGDLETSGWYYKQLITMLKDKEIMSLEKNELLWTFTTGPSNFPVYLAEGPDILYYAYYSTALTAYLRGYTGDAESYVQKANELQIGPVAESEVERLLQYDVEKLQEEQEQFRKSAEDFSEKYLTQYDSGF